MSSQKNEHINTRVFFVVSDNVHFVILIFTIHGRRRPFSESSQNSISENSIFGHFQVIFLNVIFPGAGVVISC